MSSPVVVQGTPVSMPQQAVPAGPPTNPEVRGTKQETRCNDIPFAILFYCNVVAILIVAAAYGPDALSPQEDENGDTDDLDYTGYAIASVICVFISIIVSVGGLLVMMCIPETLIKAALIFVVIMTGLWMVIMFLSGAILGGIFGLIFFAITICYARAVWSRIPFASANLVTSITAIKANWGVIVYAFIITAVAGGWSLAWSVAFIGVFDRTYECDENDVCTDPNYGYLFLLFVSYFFAHQVLQSTVHVIVAGLLGNWWFEPDEAAHCCSPAVNNSFLRATTTSFGSICFGSLIVAVLDALRMLAHTARGMDDGGIGVCIAECILDCLARIVEYFNKWAYIYVGLYGYSYMEAGKNVFTLFQNRGWEAIIADDLVQNVLLLVSLVVGAIVGVLGVIIEVLSDLFDDAGGDAKAVAFFLGFLIGLLVCSVALSTIGSGVNAVIVLFAEAPAEFQQNHPQLSEKMRNAWSLVYPGSI